MYNDCIFQRNKGNYGKNLEYYEENGSFQFLQKMQRFVIEGIGYIDEQYFVLSKENIQYFIDEAVKIWEDDGNEEKLTELRKQYLRELTEVKALGIMLQNKEKNDAAMNCMLPSYTMGTMIQ